MPRLINPVGWRISKGSQGTGRCGESVPLLALENDKGNSLFIHPVDERLVRVVHSGPDINDTTLGLKDREGIPWEKRRAEWSLDSVESSKHATIRCSEAARNGGLLRLEVSFEHSVVISWFWDGEQQSAREPFLVDFKTAYSYDARTGRMNHLVCRDSYMPLSEHVKSANNTHPAEADTKEFVYGLGETKGPMMKGGKRYIIEGRDSLGADPEETDPLYKLCPFYSVFRSDLAHWYGLFYNTLSPSVFDFGGEHDFSTGNFRSFSVEHGPLDYYLLLGHEEAPSLPGIVSQLARLVTPSESGPVGSAVDGWQASPTLPPISQFGYLASSLTLSERFDAQKAVMEYVRETRENGFAIDGMHLSSGYCQDANTGHRNYFTWDLEKYPNPADMGRELERDLNCQVIINVKPWLLETHPLYKRTALAGAFIRAAPDARPLIEMGEPRDGDRCSHLPSKNARTIHWSAQMGDTAKGSFFDYSSISGSREWQRLMQEGIFRNNISGIWIDNNEFGTLVDDDEELKGDVALWSMPQLPSEIVDERSREAREDAEVSQRFGWGRKPISVGAVGRGVLTMGMARATYDALCREHPNTRPVVVTRSFVPGMQAFAHGSWSGDNTTTWLSLKWSTKMTLSVGLSCGPGLYGHDIGGFAGAHSPSPELLLRWCQQSLWHTRFTIHSWKKISTTLWMYPDVIVTLRGIIRQRYRLIPMLYSLYVCDYHRKGWPVLKPLLWYHSSDHTCLTQDEQVIVGSHVLVAPVTAFSARSVNFHLPSLVDGEQRPARWYDVQNRRWLAHADRGQEITLDAPLDVLPTLVRDGGMIVLGPPCERHAREHIGNVRQARHVQLFPRPEGDSKGQFRLIEDDGTSNEATRHGRFTELRLYFDAVGSASKIQVGVDVGQVGFSGVWTFSFEMPEGDGRALDLRVDQKDQIEQWIEGQNIIVKVV